MRGPGGRDIRPPRAAFQPDFWERGVQQACHVTWETHLQGPRTSREGHMRAEFYLENGISDSHGWSRARGALSLLSAGVPISFSFTLSPAHEIESGHWRFPMGVPPSAGGTVALWSAAQAGVRCGGARGWLVHSSWSESLLVWENWAPLASQYTNVEF